MLIYRYYKHLDTLKVLILKKKCKNLGIVGYSKLKKGEILVILKQHISCILIQNWYRDRLSSSDLCNITQSKFKYPCWPFVSKVNCKKYWYYYNLPDLVDYLLQSGKFVEPHIGRQMTSLELVALDKYAKKVGLNRKSVYQAKKNPERFKRMKLREDLLQTIDNEIRTIVTEMRDRLLNLDDNLQQISLFLDISYYPNLNYFLSNFRRKSSKNEYNITIKGSINILNDDHIIYQTESRLLLKDNICEWLTNKLL